MKALKNMALAMGLCATALWGVACSDDPAPVDAGGMDATVGNPDAPPGNPDAPPGTDTGPGQMDAAVDGGVGDTGPGPQRFSDFVKNLINTQTNATSSPVALPAEGTLIDTEDQAEYQDLFP